MANYFHLQDKRFKVGDEVQITYKVFEGEKLKAQNFAGILIGVKGNKKTNKMITIRKISKSGIGVERIFPLTSPLITNVVLKKESRYQKAKAYFIRSLSSKLLQKKLFHKK